MKDWRHWGVKVRKSPDHNYHAVWSNLKTIRLGSGVALDLPYDRKEFYDIAINNKCENGCSFCFTPNMKVGDKLIQDINIGEITPSFNKKTQLIEDKRVDQIHERDYVGELIELELEDGTVLRSTPNHLFYTVNRGWIKAGGSKRN